MAKKRQKQLPAIAPKLIAPLQDRDMRWWAQVVAAADARGKQFSQIDRQRWEARTT